MTIDQLSLTFAALADPTRRSILTRLAEGEATVGELAEPFTMSLPAISRHLKVLERAGLIVRSRNFVSNIGAGLKSIVGGEIGGYTKLLSDGRTLAVERLKEAASAKGANAVLAMRFDTGDIGGTMNEVAAYGTAVRIQPKTKSAKNA